MSNVIQELLDFRSWITALKDVDNDILVSPIAPGKWSPSEIIYHVSSWDTYISEQMIPNIKSEVLLTFGGHTLNEQVRVSAKEIGDSYKIIEHFSEERLKLVELVRKIDKAVVFYVGKRHCTILTFVDRYISSHDKHHKEQIQRHILNEKSVG